MPFKTEIPQVVLSPQVENAVAEDADLAKFIREFSTAARQSMQAVADGRYADFNEAMRALGYNPKPLSPTDPDFPDILDPDDFA